MRFTNQNGSEDDNSSRSGPPRHALPSSVALMSAATDPTRSDAHAAHRDAAARDSYKLVLRLFINRIKDSIQ